MGIPPLPMEEEGAPIGCSAPPFGLPMAPMEPTLPTLGPPMLELPTAPIVPTAPTGARGIALLPLYGPDDASRSDPDPVGSSIPSMDANVELPLPPEKAFWEVPKRLMPPTSPPATPEGAALIRWEPMGAGCEGRRWAEGSGSPPHKAPLPPNRLLWLELPPAAPHLSTLTEASERRPRPPNMFPEGGPRDAPPMTPFSEDRARGCPPRMPLPVCR
mmetsp:Transcript_35430/g.75639  ORF Transcript_35430/g.75639 Transcript_35430/m.75639 type:complete len:216 (-) Transcript_35430:652-1299(-)